MSQESKTCIINNPYCTPCPCANCHRIFCAHEHPERRSFGSYGQYCTAECRDAKTEYLLALGRTRFDESRVVLVVEDAYCYLVCNRKKHNPAASRGYAFKVLHESAKTPTEPVYLDYCHYPGLSSAEYPLTYALQPKLQIVLYVYDEYDNSVWTMLGFRLLPDGTIDTYGVGGHITVIDQREKGEH